jgi:type I restriction enzyme S subunit
MESDWKRVNFTEVVDINPNVPLIRGKVYPFVDMKSIDENRKYVDIAEFREFSGGGSRFLPGDTLMARITPCLENGKTACYRPSTIKDYGESFGSTEFIVLRGKKGITSSKFVYYLARWNEFRNFAIGQMTGSSGRQRVPINSLSDFVFYLPPLEEQQKITDILGSLDDKIEHNRQMNQTLEAMARAIFKSWFVDFDPVYAKMEGRDYPLPPETMDLFPDELEESELGLIPKGWRVCTVSEEFRITMGQSPPGSSYNEEGIGLPFFQGRRDFGFRFPTERVYCTDPKRFAEKNDTLVSVRAPVGDINMAMDECCIGRGVAAIRHNSGSTSYTYYSMQRLKDVFNKFEAEGTVFGSISKDNFENISYIQPNLNVICAFENISKYLDLKIANNLSQSIVLAKMRDHLISVMLKGGIYV